MADFSRQRRPEAILFPFIATAALQIGTSVVLAHSAPPRNSSTEYGLESAVSPSARDLRREIALLKVYLQAHGNAGGNDGEAEEISVNHSHVSRAMASASAASDVFVTAQDFAAVMAIPARFPRTLDSDYDEE